MVSTAGQESGRVEGQGVVCSDMAHQNVAMEEVPIILQESQMYTDPHHIEDHVQIHGLHVGDTPVCDHRQLHKWSYKSE